MDFHRIAAKISSTITSGDVIDITDRLLQKDPFAGIDPSIVGFPKDVYPDYYLARSGPDSYILVDFEKEGLYDAIKQALKTKMTLKNVMKMLKNIDVSVWHKNDGGDSVEWMHGNEITSEYLQNIEIQTMPPFRSLHSVK
jgi:hypothetical protein